MTTHQKGLGFAFVTAVSWAVLAIGLKWALVELDSGSIAWSRMIFSTFFLIAFYLFMSPQKLSILKDLPWLGVVSGLCLSANYFGFMKGIELTSASNAQIMIQMAPMSLILIGIFYFKEHPSLQQKIGFLLAFTGFVLFYWDQLLNTLQNQTELLWGNLWLVMAAATWAVFATIQKLLQQKWTPQQLNLLIYFVSCFALFPTVELKQFQNLNLSMWGLLLALGVNTLVAYGSFAEALKRAPASHVSVIVAANPLLTLTILKVFELLGRPILQRENVDFLGYLGAGLVVTGVICTVKKPQSKMKDLSIAS